jgi:hypothetical protein
LRFGKTYQSFASATRRSVTKSSSLGASVWEDADTQIVEVSVAAEGDGTERVTVRLTSTFDAQPGCLLRLSVTAP